MNTPTMQCIFSIPRRFKRMLPFLLACLVVVCCSASTAPAQPLAMSDADSGKVEVGGYELYYLCVGEGSPTVILEAGGGRDSTEWELVMLNYGQITRICAYDRANLGNSDQVPAPRTYADAARDLHTLLQNAPIEGPYILVGHSGGGMIAWLYASQYPAEVVGLVLVDSAHPDMGDRLLAALPPETSGEEESIVFWRQYATILSTSDGRGPNAIEGMDMLASNASLRAVTSLGDLPLAVVSRSPENPVLMPGLPSLPGEISAAFLQQWQDMQAELEGLSSNSTRFIAEHSGHNIPEEDPRFLVEAIRYIVDEYLAEAGIDLPPVPQVVDDSSHVPVITGITLRQEWEKGILVLYEDIAFSDPAGDAVRVVNNPASSSVTLNLADGMIDAPGADQQQGTVLTTGIRCLEEGEMVLAVQVIDAAGNMSSPETVTFSCPAPKAYAKIIPLAGIVLVVLVSGLAAWLLVRHARRKRVK